MVVKGGSSSGGEILEQWRGRGDIKIGVAITSRGYSPG